MANSLVIRKRTDLAKRSRALRAAQYVRMSRDLQRYSIQNQAATIASYAQQKCFTIVRTYVDDGRSGLRIKGRPGLIELIDDVQAGRADFDHLLVYDVSRWGRFQDVDESAYYEFICKQNGVNVVYCAEQFDNDGSLLSSIVKNIKRVMAAEYSRELSVKVHAGQSRIAGLGYRVGGPLTFGLRRELIDEDQLSKGRLAKGQRKSLQTDRVRLQPGSDDEAATVRCIFHQFAIERKTGAEIARRLNRACIDNQHGRPWTDNMVHSLLKNENYVGNIVFNRTSRRLGQKRVKNPQHLWIRSAPTIAPIVDKTLFARAQKLLEDRYIALPEEQMLARLRIALAKKGTLNGHLIDKTPGLPSAASYVRHFGSLRKAYALIGYKSSRDCKWIDDRGYWSGVLLQHAAQIAKTLCTEVDADDNSVGLAKDGIRRVSFLVARHLKLMSAKHAVEQWRVRRRQSLAGMLVVLRLDEANETIRDYLLLPPQTETRLRFDLSDKSLARHNAVTVKNVKELVSEIETRLGASASTSSRRRLSKPKMRN
jgi:DNA invertase Pin-like site-specific DNA recombinase